MERRQVQRALTQLQQSNAQLPLTNFPYICVCLRAFRRGLRPLRQLRQSPVLRTLRSFSTSRRSHRETRQTLRELREAEMFVRNMGFIAMEVERLISELHRTCVDPGRPDRAAAAAALILIWPFGVNLDPPSIAVLLRREFNTDQMRTVYEGWLPLRPAEIATPPRRLESEDEGAGEPEQDFGVSDLEQSEDEF